MNILKSLVRDERGATAIEYGLLVAMMAMTMLTALDSFGATLAGVVDTAANTLLG